MQSTEPVKIEQPFNGDGNNIYYINGGRCSGKVNRTVNELVEYANYLQKENQSLKEQVDYLRSIERKEENSRYEIINQKYKEVIDKIDKYINDYNVFEVFSFPLMKRWEEEQIKSSIDYEFKSSLIKDLKDILKEVSE